MEQRGQVYFAGDLWQIGQRPKGREGPDIIASELVSEGIFEGPAMGSSVASAMIAEETKKGRRTSQCATAEVATRTRPKNREYC